MTPLTPITQASDHIISLILKCNEHQSQQIAHLVESVRTLSYITDPVPFHVGAPIEKCVPCPLEDYPEHVRAAFVPQADGVTLTEQPAAPAAPRRTRRTKEQIAADEAAAKAAVSRSEPEEPAENPETTPETPPELPTEEEAPTDDIPALRAEIGKVFAERKIEPGFKSCLANFLMDHDSETVVKLADKHVGKLLKTLKDFAP